VLYQEWLKLSSDPEKDAYNYSFEEWLEIECTTVEIHELEEYDENDYSQKYKVYTDSEADDEWDVQLENYIEECILPELPTQYWSYFDNEGWKKDARYDGRGHSLSQFDGSENEQTVNGTTYYLYRIN
jgi:hypothetical protein